MKKIILMPALALLTGALMLFSSCSKQDDNCGAPLNSQNEKALKNKVASLISKLPHIKFNKTIGSGTPSNTPPTFNFSDHNSGFNFSSSPGGFTFSDGSGTMTFSSGSFGANTGGTVVAGSSLLDINYTFCFSDSGAGLDLFDFGGFGTVSSVIGVSGDFSMLGNTDSTTQLDDVFKGLAFYIVYDDQVEGSHDVINWLDGDLSDTTATDGNAFAFVFDFQQGKLYISSKGTITVSGGTMNYNGEYFEIGGFLDDSGDFDVSDPDGLTIKKVSGYGAMGCN